MCPLSRPGLRLGMRHPHEHPPLRGLFVPEGAALDPLADCVLFNTQTAGGLLDGDPVLGRVVGRVPVLPHALKGNPLGPGALS
jgi:hypothetical protein